MYHCGAPATCNPICSIRTRYSPGGVFAGIVAISWLRSWATNLNGLNVAPHSAICYACCYSDYKCCCWMTVCYLEPVGAWTVPVSCTTWCFTKIHCSRATVIECIIKLEPYCRPSRHSDRRRCRSGSPVTPLINQGSTLHRRVVQWLPDGSCRLLAPSNKSCPDVFKPG